MLALDPTLTLFLAIFVAVFVANVSTTVLGVGLNVFLMKRQQSKVRAELAKRNPLPKTS